MEISKGSMVGHNQLVYKLNGPVEAKKLSTCKVVIKGDVRVHCISPKKRKGEKIIIFPRGTIFSYA